MRNGAACGHWRQRIVFDRERIVQDKRLVVVGLRLGRDMRLGQGR